MIIKWLDTREVVAFAEEITLEIERLFPLGEKLVVSRSAKKNSKKLDGLLLRVGAYSASRRLNIYKKAKFLNAIKWKLQDAGYESQFVADIVTLLTPVLNA